LLWPPRDKKQILRKEKEDERLTDRIVLQTEGESAFEREGPVEQRFET